MPRPGKSNPLPTQHRPFVPPLAHKVHITHPYTPAAGTDVRDTFARVQGLQATARRTRRAAAPTTGQPDLFAPAADGQVLPFPSLESMLKRRSA